MSALRSDDDQPEPQADERRLQLVEEVTAVLVREDEAVEQASVEVQEAVAAARAVEIRSPADLEAAVEILAQIARTRKNLERERKFFKEPHLEGGRRVDGRFNALKAPLDAADRELRPKVLAYQEEQERQRVAEQERLDAQRRQREREAEEQQAREAAEAQSRREAAAREAARAEAEAEAAKKRRAEQLAQEAADLEIRAAQAPDEVLQSASERQDRFGEVARAELEQRRQVREAQERAAAAAAAEEEARRAEEEARSRPLPEVPRAEVAAPAAMVAASGSASTHRRKAVEIVDEAKLPREFLMPDMRRIRAAALAGVSIPGVVVREVTGLQVRAS